ncbi:MAG: sigma factor-like helix-turn-helix DNA-binding protein [Patescibacteria group bacterium]|nr:sigma factor-like helix-turn-helix DNA-binding protein [Patescibacteria group bacterium]MDD4304872.1 sigma factor-like helix-turn-helix DNA-binding protein [Patescibacteria group bacterium]MDD4695778.1 sigma factor-like helix-turn-helix DNA-binding protein [Patescibacteria group bacterium]
MIDKSENSILEKVIASNKEKAKFEFDPKQIVADLLKNLNDREKEIISKRYSLKDNEKATLDSIGKTYNITRERVRQIENIAIKKIKNISDKIDTIKYLDGIINDTLSEYLGVLGEDTLIKKILEDKQNDEIDYNVIKFLIDKVLSDKYLTEKENDEFLSIYRVKNHDLEEFYDAINKIVELFNKRNQTIHRDELWQTYENEQDINFKNDKINENILLNYLNPSKKIQENPLGDLGLSDWKSIIPKRMSDKIYLIMKNLNKPLHFKDIADEINKMNFDKKIAHPATIHNELILDDKYVLVGRGIYALKKWGYEPGKVTEVVEKVLKENGPMSKDELIKKVSEKKLVKKTTINLAIINNKNVKKNKEGKYYYEGSK